VKEMEKWKDGILGVFFISPILQLSNFKKSLKNVFLLVAVFDNNAKDK